MMLGIPVPCSKYYNYYSDTNTKVSIIAPYIMMLYRYYTFSRPLLSKYYSDTISPKLSMIAPYIMMLGIPVPCSKYYIVILTPTPTPTKH